MPTIRLLEYGGVYGAPSSREELIRALKEALALVENLPRGTPVSCSPWQISAEAPYRDSHPATPGGIAGAPARGRGGEPAEKPEAPESD